MNKHLALLIELSNIDKEIDSFIPKEKEINKGIDALQAKFDKNNKSVADLISEKEQNHQKKLKSEAHLAELSEKLKDIDKKNNSIKNEKELKALHIEEGIAKEQIIFINEEIERLDKVDTAKTEEIKNLEAENKEIKIQVEDAKTNAEDELKALENTKKESFLTKEKLTLEVPQKVLSFYQKVRRWAGNTTVVPVRKQACWGCHMKIGDKTYAEVIKSEEIITCPSCGRIVYIESTDK